MSPDASICPKTEQGLSDCLLHTLGNQGTLQSHKLTLGSVVCLEVRFGFRYSYNHLTGSPLPHSNTWMGSKGLAHSKWYNTKPDPRLMDVASTANSEESTLASFRPLLHICGLALRRESQDTSPDLTHCLNWKQVFLESSLTRKSKQGA